MWRRKRGQRQCVKICGSDMFRDPATNRCKKIPVQRQIPPGMEINPQTGRLRKVCLPGQYRDPVTKRCRRIKEDPFLTDAPVPILQPLLAGGQMMPTDYRDSTYMPSAMAAFGRYGRHRYGGRKCGFGTCKACAR